MISVGRARELVVEALDRYNVSRDKLDTFSAFQESEPMDEKDKRILDEEYEKFKAER